MVRFSTKKQFGTAYPQASSRAVLRDRNYDLIGSADIIGCGDAYRLKEADEVLHRSTARQNERYFQQKTPTEPRRRRTLEP